MRGEDGMELQAVEQGQGLAAPALVHQLVVGNRDVVDGILVLGRGDGLLAGAQGLDAIVLLADVRQVEVGRECPRQHGRGPDVQRVDDGDGVGEGGRAALAVDAGGILLDVGTDGVRQQGVEGMAQFWVVLGQDLAHQAQEERHVLLEVVRDVDLGQRRSGGRALQLGLVDPNLRRSCGDLVLQSIDFRHCASFLPHSRSADAGTRLYKENCVPYLTVRPSHTHRRQDAETQYSLDVNVCETSAGGRHTPAGGISHSPTMGDREGYRVTAALRRTGGRDTSRGRRRCGAGHPSLRRP